MYEMCHGCSGLKSLNLGNNDFKSAEYKSGAFYQVGTASTPCKLIIGSDFDKSVLGNLVEGTPSYYEWLDGYFTEPTVVTGIDSIKVPAGGVESVYAPTYNLAGQRVGENYKGMVIMKGKKVLRK